MNEIHDFYEHFLLTSRANEMRDCVENSSWHREENVLVHTSMVLAEYVAQVKAKPLGNPLDLLGAIIAIYHDTGKPMARKSKVDAAGAERFIYAGHELYSANIFFEDYLGDFFISDKLRELITLEQAILCRFVIEHHLPYNKNGQGFAEILTALFHYVEKAGITFECEAEMQSTVKEWFARTLLADARGRISDNKEYNLANTQEWIDKNVLTPLTTTKSAEPQVNVAWIVIGVSGAGKSTIVKKIGEDFEGQSAIFNLDSLRYEFYYKYHGFTFTTENSNERYSIVWNYANENSGQFNNFAIQHLKNLTTSKDAFEDDTPQLLISDNTNGSKKLRKMFLRHVQQRHVIATLLICPLATCIARQQTRGDKNVKVANVKQQWYAQSLPLIGAECDSLVLQRTTK